MVNVTETTPIEFNGTGYVARIKRNYLPGEYRTLSNVELNDRELAGRRSILSTYDLGLTASPMHNTYAFVGFIDGFAIRVSKNSQEANRSDGVNITSTDLWQPSSLTVPAGGSSYHRIVGAFEYNRKYYWLTEQYTESEGFWGTFRYYLYYKDANSFGLGSGVTFGSLTEALVLTTSNSPYRFRNFFLHKDRLWIVTSEGLYCSKASDPTIFTVPDGFFIKYPDSDVSFAFALKDVIYVLADNSIFSLTYTNDPNQDSFSKSITDRMGASHGCIHGGIPYVVNGVGIYMIDGGSIVKYKDNHFDVTNNPSITKLVSFGDYLIVCKANLRHYDKNYTGNHKEIGLYYDEDPDALNNNLIFIDTELDKTHVINFYDCPKFPSKTRGYVVDVVVSNTPDFFNDAACYFLTNRYVSDDVNAWNYYSQVYHMSSKKQSYFIFDRVVDGDNIVRKYKPNYVIEFDSFTPDGTEYLTKKFRHLMLMGNYPFRDFEYSIAYDNMDYTEFHDLNVSTNNIEATGEPRTPYAAWIPLNQKAKSISIMFRTKDPFVSILDSEIYDSLRLTEISVVWTPSARGPSYKTPIK